MELPVRLKTAGEMYQYSCDHGFGTGFGKNWGMRNFLILEQKLEAGEFAFLTFVGLHRFHSMSAHQRIRHHEPAHPDGAVSLLLADPV